MATYLLLFFITFTTTVCTALLINYCKRRAQRTQHGLTGMCHKNGGTMCHSCASRMDISRQQSTQED